MCFFLTVWLGEKKPKNKVVSKRCAEKTWAAGLGDGNRVSERHNEEKGVINSDSWVERGWISWIYFVYFTCTFFLLSSCWGEHVRAGEAWISRWQRSKKKKKKCTEVCQTDVFLLFIWRIYFLKKQAFNRDSFHLEQSLCVALHGLNTVGVFFFSVWEYIFQSD